MDSLPTDLSEKTPDFLEVCLEYVVAADVVAQDVLNYYEGSAPGTVYCVAIDVLPPNQRFDHVYVATSARKVEGVAVEELASAELLLCRFLTCVNLCEDRLDLTGVAEGGGDVHAGEVEPVDERFQRLHAGREERMPQHLLARLRPLLRLLLQNPR